MGNTTGSTYVTADEIGLRISQIGQEYSDYSTLFTVNKLDSTAIRFLALNDESFNDEKATELLIKLGIGESIMHRWRILTEIRIILSLQSEPMLSNVKTVTDSIRPFLLPNCSTISEDSQMSMVKKSTAKTSKNSNPKHHTSKQKQLSVASFFSQKAPSQAIEQSSTQAPLKIKVWRADILNKARNMAANILGVSMTVNTVGKIPDIVKQQRQFVNSVVKTFDDRYENLNYDTVTEDFHNQILQIMLEVDTTFVPMEHGGTYAPILKGGKGKLIGADMEASFSIGKNADEPSPASKRHSVHCDDLISTIKLSYTHMWSKNGEHIGFRNAKGLMDICKESLNVSIATSTANRWILKEKKLYAQNKGHRTQPHTVQLIQQYKKQKELLDGTEPQFSNSKSKQLIFKREWYAELIEAIRIVEGIVGFGPKLVGAIVEDIMERKEDTHQVDMSYQWVLWFMSTLNPPLVRRKITSGKVAPHVTEDIERLHLLNLDKLYEMMSVGGLSLDHFVMSDQFGMSLFSVDDYVWTRKGTKHVLGEGQGDKRQFTGNLFLSPGTRSIVRVEMIFQGKSRQCLPTDNAINAAKDKGKSLGFDLVIMYTENHWSNQAITLEGIDWFKQFVYDDMINKGNSPKVAAEAPCLYSLDCWKVNLTPITKEHFKKTVPHGQQQYIPAKGTGSKQVNDTHAHAPLKKRVSKLIEAWYRARVKEWNARLKNEEISLAVYQQEINNLTSGKLLKNLAPMFLVQAIEDVLLKDRQYNEVNMNVIQKGFSDLYLKNFEDKIWCNQSKLRTERRNEQAAEASKNEQAAQAANADMVTDEKSLKGSTEEDVLIKEIAKVEDEAHNREVPQLRKEYRENKSGKRRRGRRVSDSFRGEEEKRGASAKEEVDNILEGGVRVEYEKRSVHYGRETANLAVVKRYSDALKQQCESNNLQIRVIQRHRTIQFYKSLLQSNGISPINKKEYKKASNSTSCIVDDEIDTGMSKNETQSILPEKFGDLKFASDDDDDDDDDYEDNSGSDDDDDTDVSSNGDSDSDDENSATYFALNVCEHVNDEMDPSTWETVGLRTPNEQTDIVQAGTDSRGNKKKLVKSLNILREMLNIQNGFIPRNIDSTKLELDSRKRLYSGLEVGFNFTALDPQLENFCWGHSLNALLDVRLDPSPSSMSYWLLGTVISLIRFPEGMKEIDFDDSISIDSPLRQAIGDLYLCKPLNEEELTPEHLLSGTRDFACHLSKSPNAVKTGISTHLFYRVCTALNPNACATATTSSNTAKDIFIGTRSIPCGLLRNCDELYEAVRPGNAVSIYHKAKNAVLGHFVTSWTQLDHNGVMYYFFFDSNAATRLVAALTSSDLFSQMNIHKTGLSVFDVNAIRTLFIFNLPTDLYARKLAVLKCAKNINVLGNRLLTDYLHLDKSSFHLPHNFMPHILAPNHIEVDINSRRCEKASRDSTSSSTSSSCTTSSCGISSSSSSSSSSSGGNSINSINSMSMNAEEHIKLFPTTLFAVSELNDEVEEEDAHFSFSRNELKKKQRQFKNSITRVLEIIDKQNGDIAHSSPNPVKVLPDLGNPFGFSFPALESQYACLCWGHALYANLGVRLSPSAPNLAYLLVGIVSSFTGLEGDWDLDIDYNETRHGRVKDSVTGLVPLNKPIYTVGPLSEHNYKKAVHDFCEIVSSDSTAVSKGLTTIRLYKVLCALNENIGSYPEFRNDERIFLGSRPIAPGTLSSISLFFEAIKPGTAGIVFFNDAMDAMGHYVSFWVQHNASNCPYFFFFDPMAITKLLGDTSPENLNVQMENLGMTNIFRTTDGIRVLFVLDLPVQLDARGEKITIAIENLNASSKFITTRYLKLSDKLPHFFVQQSPQTSSKASARSTKIVAGPNDRGSCKKARTQDITTTEDNTRAKIDSTVQVSSANRIRKASSLQGSIKPGKYSKPNDDT